MNSSTPPGATPRERPRRLRELDALRGIAALGVVVWHYGAHFGARPLLHALLPAYRAGFLLVDFFFVLSGFVIARAYWRPERRTSLGANIWTRIARLYPLHLATLVAAALLLWRLDAVGVQLPFEARTDGWHFLLNLLLLNQSGLQQAMSFNIPAWSISAEFIVNVGFLVFIAAGWRWRVAMVAGGALLILLASQFVPGPLLAKEAGPGIIDGNLARCVAGFTAGIAIAFIPVSRIDVPSWFFDVGAAIGLLSLTAFLIVSHEHPPLWHYVVSIVISGTCVASVPHSGLARRLLDRRWLTWLGDISYSIYLVHFPLQLAALLLAATWFPIDFQQPLVLLSFMAVVLAMSTLSYRWLELPAQAMLLRLRGRPASIPMQPSRGES